MKEKYFRPTVTNSAAITNGFPFTIIAVEGPPIPVFVARKLMDETSIVKKDGLKILEKK